MYKIHYDFDGELVARDIEEVLAIVEDLLVTEGSYHIDIEEEEE